MYVYCDICMFTCVSTLHGLQSNVTNHASIHNILSQMPAASSFNSRVVRPSSGRFPASLPFVRHNYFYYDVTTTSTMTSQLLLL